MGRPKVIADADVLEAAARVIGRRGPVDFTLREVADEAGLSAPAIVQRFRSKRGLLLALERGATGAVADAFDAATARHNAPLEALVEALASRAAAVRTPTEMANHLAFLAVDLNDRAFHKLTLDSFDDLHARAENLLAQALARGELARGTDPRALARLVEVAYNGALVTWAIRRQGSAPDAVRAALRPVLGLTPSPAPPAAARGEGRASR